MKIAVIGTGYVGLVTGTCLAEHGNNIICVDANPKVIELLNSGEIPIEEDGLKELVERNVQSGNLTFTTNLQEAVLQSNITFICVGTPSADDGSADLTYVYAVAEEIGNAIEKSSGEKLHIIVDKSTVPVGTGDEVEHIIKNKTNKKICVVSNPEFLAEGRAVKDSMFPSRVVIGTDNEEARETLTRLYSTFFRNTGEQGKILYMNRIEAELTKYAANSLLATKISFMNDIANLCEIVGADVTNIKVGIGSDPRIGSSFLYPSLGYGGSCFPKDVKAILHIASKRGYNLAIIKATHEINERQKEILFKKILKYFGEDLQGKTFAVWGLAFKAGTDDIRESAALVIISKLLEKGAKIKVHDPKAMKKINETFEDKIEYYDRKYDAAKGSDALIVCTEWNTFRNPDFDELKSLLKQPVIFDGRNLYDPKEMERLGFDYFGIGRGKSIEY